METLSLGKGKKTMSHVFPLVKKWRGYTTCFSESFRHAGLFASSQPRGIVMGRPDELAALINRVETDPRKWSADELAHELGVSIMPFAVRQALGLTTIGSIDVDKAARKRRRAANQRENSTAWRRRNGALPRSVYEASSLSKTKPWEAEGISRSTYERRRKKAAAEQTGADDASAYIRTRRPRRTRRRRCFQELMVERFSFPASNLPRAGHGHGRGGAGERP
jgi:hypothetical protein